MRDRVARVLVQVEEKHLVWLLRQCSGPEEKCKKLIELLPEITQWKNLMARNELLFYLHHKYYLNFGVCSYYSLDPKDDDRQYCSVGTQITECSCLIPQLSCVVRRGNGRLRHTQFVPLSIQHLEQQLLAMNLKKP